MVVGVGDRGGTAGADAEVAARHLAQVAAHVVGRGRSAARPVRERQPAASAARTAAVDRPGRSRRPGSRRRACTLDRRAARGRGAPSPSSSTSASSACRVPSPKRAQRAGQLDLSRGSRWAPAAAHAGDRHHRHRRVRSRGVFEREHDRGRGRIGSTVSARVAGVAARPRARRSAARRCWPTARRRRSRSCRWDAGLEVQRRPRGRRRPARLSSIIRWAPSSVSSAGWKQCAPGRPSCPRRRARSSATPSATGDVAVVPAGVHRRRAPSDRYGRSCRPPGSAARPCRRARAPSDRDGRCRVGEHPRAADAGAHRSTRASRSARRRARPSRPPRRPARDARAGCRRTRTSSSRMRSTRSAAAWRPRPSTRSRSQPTRMPSGARGDSRSKPPSMTTCSSSTTKLTPSCSTAGSTHSTMPVDQGRVVARVQRRRLGHVEADAVAEAAEADLVRRDVRIAGGDRRRRARPRSAGRTPPSASRGRHARGRTRRARARWLRARTCGRSPTSSRRRSPRRRRRAARRGPTRGRSGRRTARGRTGDDAERPDLVRAGLEWATLNARAISRSVMPGASRSRRRSYALSSTSPRARRRSSSQALLRSRASQIAPTRRRSGRRAPGTSRVSWPDRRPGGVQPVDADGGHGQLLEQLGERPGGRRGELDAARRGVASSGATGSSVDIRRTVAPGIRSRRSRPRSRRRRRRAPLGGQHGHDRPAVHLARHRRVAGEVRDALVAHRHAGSPRPLASPARHPRGAREVLGQSRRRARGSGVVMVPSSVHAGGAAAPVGACERRRRPVTPSVAKSRTVASASACPAARGDLGPVRRAVRARPLRRRRSTRRPPGRPRRAVRTPSSAGSSSSAIDRVEPGVEQRPRDERRRAAVEAGHHGVVRTGHRHQPAGGQRRHHACRAARLDPDDPGRGAARRSGSAGPRPRRTPRPRAGTNTRSGAGTAGQLLARPRAGSSRSRR